MNDVLIREWIRKEVIQIMTEKEPPFSLAEVEQEVAKKALECVRNEMIGYAQMWNQAEL